MPLIVGQHNIMNVSVVDEPQVRTTSSVVMSPSDRGPGGWTSPAVYAQLEPQPQWNTLGSGLFDGGDIGQAYDSRLMTWSVAASAVGDSLGNVAEALYGSGLVVERVSTTDHLVVFANRDGISAFAVRVDNGAVDAGSVSSVTTDQRTIPIDQSGDPVIERQSDSTVLISYQTYEAPDSNPANERRRMVKRTLTINGDLSISVGSPTTMYESVGVTEFLIPMAVMLGDVIWGKVPAGPNMASMAVYANSSVIVNGPRIYRRALPVPGQLVSSHLIGWTLTGLSPEAGTGPLEICEYDGSAIGVLRSYNWGVSGVPSNIPPMTPAASQADGSVVVGLVNTVYRFGLTSTTLLGSVSSSSPTSVAITEYGGIIIYGGTDVPAGTLSGDVAFTTSEVPGVEIPASLLRTFSTAGTNLILYVQVTEDEGIGVGLIRTGVDSFGGPGTDDTVLWPVENVPAHAGITFKTDYYAYLGSPARIDMAISEPVQVIEDVPQIVTRRVFVVHNYVVSGNHSVYLHYHWGNPTEIAVEDHAALYSFKEDQAEALACVLVDPAADTSVLLVFHQTLAGDVYCTPVTAAREPREDMSWPKEGNSSTRYPVERPCLTISPETLITTGGMAGERGAWVTNGFEGGDIFFSSLQAASLGNNRVLLLTLNTTGDVQAWVVTYTSSLTVSAPVTVSTGALNLYQAVTADNGLIDGSATKVAFTTRTASGGTLVTLDCAGTPTVTGTAALTTDYSHVAWVADKLAVLTKDGYSAPGTLGFGSTAVDILLYDPVTLVQVGTIDADSGIVNGIQQTGTIHGFADGRLFMHCSSYEEISYDIGHSYEYAGAGIRLFVVDGNGAMVQDQIGERQSIDASSTRCYRWGESVFVLGPTGETFGSPPGDEQPMHTNYFVGGVLKEGNSDVQPYRLTNNWLFVTEPEKNGIWYTHPDVTTPFMREVNSYYIRAIHLDSNGVPDRAGEPAWLFALWSWYSAACRIDDTHIMFIGRGYTDVAEYINNPSTASDSVYFQVIELDPVTGDLTVVHEQKDNHVVTDGVVTAFHMVQVPDTNRYLFLHTRAVGESGADLWVTSFELHDDYSATILDEQNVSQGAMGGAFTERKPYEICPITDTTYVITWIIDDLGGEHWSAHRGLILAGNGTFMMGNTLSADPSSNTDGLYGFQGYWMAKGVGINGRYVYPVMDEWPSLDRYPPILEGPPTWIYQKVPFAVMVIDIDRTTADLTASWYPCKIDKDAVDLDWYLANEFFAPEPQRTTTPLTQRIYQAHPDGALYHFWNTAQLHRGYGSDEFWMFQGPGPVPWNIGNSVIEGMTIAQYHLDDDTQTAWFRGNWGQFELPYWVSYMNGSIEMRRGLIACFGTLDYYSRASPQGWDAGFGSNILRVWSVGVSRGTAVLGPQDVRVSSEGKGI